MTTTRTSPTTDAADIERAAFNAAFYELGLRWHWDEDTYEALAPLPTERARVQHYLQAQQAHLLRAYDADFLADAILDAKARCQRTVARSGPALESGARRAAAWTDARWGEVGI